MGFYIDEVAMLEKATFNLDLGDEGVYPYSIVPEDDGDLVINYDHASSYRR